VADLCAYRQAAATAAAACWGREARPAATDNGAIDAAAVSSRSPSNADPPRAARSAAQSRARPPAHERSRR